MSPFYTQFAITWVPQIESLRYKRVETLHEGATLVNMNGAEALVATAVGAGIEICFANPGTTELPLVQALDSVPGLRGVLCLHGIRRSTSSPGTSYIFRQTSGL